MLIPHLNTGLTGNDWSRRAVEECSKFNQSHGNKRATCICFFEHSLRNVTFRASASKSHYVPGMFDIFLVCPNSDLVEKKSICAHAPQFSGSDQHDSQEFLTFLLDGLHEDLNRVLHKPSNGTTPDREAELERLSQSIASAQEWEIYQMRNDSLIVDFFQGQFRNRMECLTCNKVGSDLCQTDLTTKDDCNVSQTSTTYNSFMYLSLPMPSLRGPSKTSLQSCLDAFVKEEVLAGSEAWYGAVCFFMILL